MFLESILLEEEVPKRGRDFSKVTLLGDSQGTFLDFPQRKGR